MIRQGLLAVAAAVVLTLLSVRIQRTGPEQVVYSNLCGPTTSDLCYKPVLNGGFPIGYLFDSPGVSVEDQLAFFEDRFRWAPFVLDVAIHVVLIGIVGLARSRLMGQKRTSGA